MKVVYMGTPEFAVYPLEKLYDEGIKIPLVISQKDKPKGRGKKVLPTPVKEKALELKLEVFQPEKINDEKSVEVLKKIEPDFIVVAAYGQILKNEVLSIPKYGCINIHASLLPKYRGAAPINWAIINGEKETGVTTMKMDAGLDTGDILLMESVEISKDDDVLTIHDKLSKVGGKLIVDTLNGIKDRTLIPIKQDHSKFSYAPMLDKKFGKINWSLSGEEIFNLIRGLKPWPSAYTFYKKQNVKIHKVKVVDKISNGKDGEIVEVSTEGMFVNCKDSSIVIEELQFPGKRKMTVEEYLRGNSIEVGSILE